MCGQSFAIRGKLNKIGSIMESPICSFCLSISEHVFYGSENSAVICSECVSRMNDELLIGAPAGAKPKRKAGANALRSGQKFVGKVLSVRDKGYTISIADRDELGFLVTEMTLAIGAKLGVVFCMQHGADLLFAVDYNSYGITNP